MASSLNLGGLTKYTDQLSQALVRESVLGGETFKYITVLPNIKYADALNKMTTTLNAVAGSCGIISPTGSVALSQNVLTVCPIKVEESICEQDLEQYWTGMTMKAGSYQEELGPNTFAKVYTADKAAKLQAMQDDLFWKGSSTGTYSVDPNMLLCNGLLYLLEVTSASASVISGNGTYSTFTTMTVANAINIIDGMIDTMNTSVSQILNEPDLVLFLSYADYNTLRTALKNANYFHNDIGQTTHTWTFNYPGTNVQIVAVRGLNGLKKRLLTNASNLAVGCDIESDYSSFRIWYSDLYDMVYFRSKFKQGVGVYYYQNIVLMS